MSTGMPLVHLYVSEMSWQIDYKDITLTTHDHAENKSPYSYVFNRLGL